MEKNSFFFRVCAIQSVVTSQNIIDQMSIMLATLRVILIRVDSISFLFRLFFFLEEKGLKKNK